MPTTRKRPPKPPEREDHESNSSEEGEDFSDSGSEASIPDETDDSQSEEAVITSSDEFEDKSKKSQKKPKAKPITASKVKIVKSLYERASKVSFNQALEESPFSLKDLTTKEKLLPSVLNLSESDSDESDDGKHQTSRNSIKESLFDSSVSGSEKATTSFRGTLEDEFIKIQNNIFEGISMRSNSSDSEDDQKHLPAKKNEVGSDKNAPKKLNFERLNEQVQAIEEVKASLLKYESGKKKQKRDIGVKELLALGETFDEAKLKDDDIISSESEKDDWEEVKDTKPNVPKEGIQLLVDFPTKQKKSKTLDLEMMMKRKLNRVKKEYQVYMHKVHVLCWLAHGNYINKILNEQELMAAALSLIPSQHCYPSDRVNIKYLEQISSWYKETMALKQDMHEDKYRPKAPPLLLSLLKQIKEKTVTTNKNLVLIFICMLRALGIKTRLVLSFRVIPLRPPNSELCSLSQKDNPNKSNSSGAPKAEKSKHFKDSGNKMSHKVKQVEEGKRDMKTKISNILQVDGADDKCLPPRRSRKPISASDNVAQGSPVILTTKNKSRGKKGNESNSKLPTETKCKPSSVSNSAPLKSYWDNLMEQQGMDSTVEPERVSHRDLLDKSKKSSHSILQPEGLINQPPKDKIDVKNQPAKRLSLRSKLALNNNKNLNVMEDIKSQETTNRSAEKICSKNVRDINTTKRERDENKKSTVSTKKDEAIADKQTTTSKIKSNAKKKSMVECKYFKKEDEVLKSASKAKRDVKVGNSSSVSREDILKTTETPRKLDDGTDTGSLKRGQTRSSKSAAKNKIAEDNMSDNCDSASEEVIPPPKRRRQKSVDSEKDFHPPKPKLKVKKESKKIDRRVLSSDEETNESSRKGVDTWCEVYMEEEEQWISVDVVKAQVHCVKVIHRRASHPVTYIVAWDESCNAKDVTRRYVPQFATITRKLRIAPDWWQKALMPWLPPPSVMQRREDELLDRLQLDAPLPTAVGEYKNHPLYALQRHLLKFEAIYPPDSITLGFVRGEPVYSRDCVYTLRSRETWVKEAKVVKPGEKAYKIVKARPKWDKLSGTVITDKPLEIFGPWQIQDYEPPKAENGIVPRNPYGNVELFKPCMLPKGTVHLQLPSLHKVARKLNIDCAMAMTGFDFHSGWTHPVFDGYVVCEEYKDILIEAWEKEQEETEKRERDRIETRVYGNWKRLIKGLLIRERLQAKYDFKDPQTATAVAKKKPRRRL